MKKMNKKDTTTKTAGSLALNEEQTPDLPVAEKTARPDASHVKTLLNSGLRVDDNVTLCLVPLNMLTVDMEHYQRPQAESVQAIARNWRSDKAKVISVNYNGGYLNVVDGQRRCAAAKLAGLESIAASITVEKDLEWEIDAFITQNDNTSKISPYDLFYARWHRSADKDPVAHELKKLLDRFHIVYENPNAGKMYNGKIPSRRPGSRQVGALRCMADVMELADCGGMQLLEAAFFFIHQMGWHTLPGTYSKKFLMALVRVYKHHSPEYVLRQLSGALAGHTPAVIMAEARAQFKECTDTEALKAYFDRAVG